MLTSALAEGCTGSAWMCLGDNLMVAVGGGAFLNGMKMRRLGNIWEAWRKIVASQVICLPVI